jgi:hypothetical protein
MSFPNFQNLYGKINEAAPAGSIITFKVKNNFLVHGNKGKKFLIISTMSWFGGKRNTMGIYMIGVGVASGAIGLAFFLKNLFPCTRRKLGDLERLNRSTRRGPAGVMFTGEE